MIADWVSIQRSEGTGWNRRWESWLTDVILRWGDWPEKWGWKYGVWCDHQAVDRSHQCLFYWDADGWVNLVAMVTHWENHNRLQQRVHSVVRQRACVSPSRTPPDLVQRTTCINAFLEQDTTCINAVLQQDTTCIITVLEQDTTCITAVLQQDTTCITAVLQQDTTCINAVLQQDTTCITAVLQQDTTCITADLQQDTTCITADLQQDTTCITADLQQDTTCITAVSLEGTTCFTAILLQNITCISPHIHLVLAMIVSQCPKRDQASVVHQLPFCKSNPK